MYPPPPQSSSPNGVSECVAGEFFYGGGLVNRFEKVAIAVDTTCSVEVNLFA